MGNICNGLLLGNASIARGLTCCKNLARHEASRKSWSTKFPLWAEANHIWPLAYNKICSINIIKLLPRVPFVNCRHFMYLVISLLVLRAGCGIWLYQLLIIAYLFTLHTTSCTFVLILSVKHLKYKQLKWLWMIFARFLRVKVMWSFTSSWISVKAYCRSAEDLTFKTFPEIRRVCIFLWNQPVRFIVTWPG